MPVLPSIPASMPAVAAGRGCRYHFPKTVRPERGRRVTARPSPGIAAFQRRVYSSFTGSTHHTANHDARPDRDHPAWILPDPPSSSGVPTRFPDDPETTCLPNSSPAI